MTIGVTAAVANGWLDGTFATASCYVKLYTGDPGDVREQTLVHMTALPWFAFTAFTHARAAGDDRPKIAFGRFTPHGERLLMPARVGPRRLVRRQHGPHRAEPLRF